MQPRGDGERVVLARCGNREAFMVQESRNQFESQGEGDGSLCDQAIRSSRRRERR
jgi:hypothetical protein